MLTSILLTCGVFNYSVYGWLPKGYSLDTIEAAAKIYYNDFDRSFGAHKAFAEMLAEGAARQAAWRTIPEDERPEPYDPELMQ